MSNRTLFGQPPAKNQQLDDNYFGSIHERVYAFMLDLETEAFKLGIPIRTRHNEVAPSQFECAPYFEECNLSVDHNQLLMDLMDRVAHRHDLVVLRHEKPFAGLNGSGKHNNWSMQTNKGKNLLSPGTTPKTNLQFLTFFINTIKAVHDHNDLIRASIASAGNDHRLGGHEAPPAIISIYIGEVLREVLEEIETRVTTGTLSEKEKKQLKLDIHSKIPEIFMHNTDRNRTSPFAFTGNKFEIRGVGSSSNCSLPMIVLNTIVGDQLKKFREEVKYLRREKDEKKDMAILQVLSDYVKKSKDILFDGDNYSESWRKEAKKRGLKNLQNTPQAMDAYIEKSAKKVFTENEVFTERELEARYNIRLDNYAKRLEIESKMVEELALNHVIPAVLEYQTELVNNVSGLQNIDMDDAITQVQRDVIEGIGKKVNRVQEKVSEMKDKRDKANDISSPRKRSAVYCNEVKPYFEEIRHYIDELELIVSDEAWPLPKYREMLFIR